MYNSNNQRGQQDIDEEDYGQEDFDENGEDEQDENDEYGEEENQDMNEHGEDDLDNKMIYGNEDDEWYNKNIDKADIVAAMLEMERRTNRIIFDSRIAFVSTLVIFIKLINRVSKVSRSKYI